MEDWVPSYLWNDPNFVSWWNGAPDSERMTFIREQNKQNSIVPVSLPTQQKSEIMARPNYQYREYKDYSSEIPSDETPLQGSRSDWMSSALAVGNGLTSIFNTSKNMANIADTSQQQNMIQDLGNIGSTQYSNWEQIGMDYDRFNNLQPNLSFDAIRGGSTEERVGSVLSNTATGAMTGLQVGGPWGALAGGIIGAGAGIGGWLVGDKDAETELKDLRLKRYLAQDRAMSNLVSGIDNYSNYQFKNGIGTMKKNGGPIQRKRTPIKAEKVKGGTKIRIKR